MTLMSTGISVAQQVAQAKFQADMADYNAKLAEADAFAAAESGKHEAADIQRRTAILTGAQRNARAGTTSGFDINSGDLVNIYAGTAARGAEAVAGAQFRTSSAVFQRKGEAAGLRASGEFSRSSINATIVGGAFNMAGQVASSWYRYKGMQAKLGGNFGSSQGLQASGEFAPAWDVSGRLGF
jgi:hypothetical protein